MHRSLVFLPLNNVLTRGPGDTSTRGSGPFQIGSQNGPVSMAPGATKAHFSDRLMGGDLATCRLREFPMGYPATSLANHLRIWSSDR